MSCFIDDEIARAQDTRRLTAPVFSARLPAQLALQTLKDWRALEEITGQHAELHTLHE